MNKKSLLKIKLKKKTTLFNCKFLEEEDDDFCVNSNTSKWRWRVKQNKTQNAYKRQLKIRNIAKE